MYKLTDKGKDKANAYIRELVAKRKEILDAGLDTADKTTITNADTIEADINKREELYNWMCRLMTQYENAVTWDDKPSAEDFYDLCVEMQHYWESDITAQSE